MDRKISLLQPVTSEIFASGYFSTNVFSTFGSQFWPTIVAQAIFNVPCTFESSVRMASRTFSSFSSISLASWMTSSPSGVMINPFCVRRNNCAPHCLSTDCSLCDKAGCDTNRRSAAFRIFNSCAKTDSNWHSEKFMLTPIRFLWFMEKRTAQPFARCRR
ncbi:hypothetical protein BF29_3470 [Heyndrickxia coagulans DSM 1 = ATCC 7050]|nr:hypothetical protein BF29_3470 [Heyndrickxia coagulans DSM 1 = ATCC 7050]